MIGLKEFRKEVSDWSVETFELWLSNGAAKVFGSPSDRWQLAFPPLLLDEQTDSTNQILIAINALDASAYQNIRTALGLVLRNLPTRSAPEVVTFFFRMSATLKPSGIVDVIEDLMRRQAVRSHFELWADTIRNGFVAACDYVYSTELDELLFDVRGTKAWSIDLIRHYLASRLRARPANWVQLIEEFEADISELRVQNSTEFSLFLRQFVRTVRVERIERSLLPVVINKLKWFADELFGPSGPLHIDRRLNLSSEASSVPINAERPGLSPEQSHELTLYVLTHADAEYTPFQQSKKLLLERFRKVAESVVMAG